MKKERDTKSPDSVLMSSVKSIDPTNVKSIDPPSLNDESRQVPEIQRPAQRCRARFALAI